MNVPNYGGCPVATNNNSELNDDVVILFTKANNNDDGKNLDCIERTTVGFFKFFRTVV